MDKFREDVLNTIIAWDNAKKDNEDDPVYIRSCQEHEADYIIEYMKDFREYYDRYDKR